jgi:peptidoglycan LD-endopeptidase CwlK
MAADINLLVPAFRTKVTKLLNSCAARGVIMRPYFTIRTPLEQAKLWRQSRSIEEITLKIIQLKANGAPYLASRIEKAGAQNGDPVTNAIPGLSWHQWGEAVDCFWLVNGDAEWSSKVKINGDNGYNVYAEEAQKIGLTAGGLFKSLKDWPHMQLKSDSDPSKTKSLSEIDAEMRIRFG